MRTVKYYGMKIQSFSVRWHSRARIILLKAYYDCPWGEVDLVNCNVSIAAL